MRIAKKKIKLYHLSETNCDGKTFKPRVPESICDDPELENQKVKRVCFSSSLSGAYRAISDVVGYEDILYVHIPENIDEIISNNKLIKPSEDDVFDVHETGEYWITQKVKLKCIGVAKFKSDYDWFDNEKENIKFRWIEKF